MNQARAIIIAAMLLATLAACGPEAGRAVGGGPGADIGNHAPTIPKSKIFGQATTGEAEAEAE